jgi:predicted Fe-S protein YdhL (DUF1289 family)
MGVPVTDDYVPSPCNNVCDFDSSTSMCTACWRTLDEITEWPMMSNAEKRAVLEAAERRHRQAEEDG